MNRRARALSWQPLLLLFGLLLQTVAKAAYVVVEPACKMNVFEPAPDGARLEGENLLAGLPEVSYPPYAYSRIPGSGYVLCTCEIKTCIFKCCSPGKAFNGTRCSEISDSMLSAHTFEIPKFVNMSGIVKKYEMDQVRVVYDGGPKCITDHFEVNPANDPDHNFGVSLQGDLQNETGSHLASPEEFCLEQLINEDDFQIMAIVCARNDVSNSSVTGNRFHIPPYTKVMITSLPFLLLTFFVYAVITELHDNLHGKSLMCFVASLFFAYTTCVINQIAIVAIPDAYEFCINLVYIQQFSFLATFFWLNIMCFDLWTNFRVFNQNITEYKAKKFINYSKYAWGCSFLISMFTFFMEKYLSIQHGLQIILPEFEYYNTCWFSSQEDKLLYFHGPIGITLLSNLFMFIYNAIIMIVKYLRYAEVPIEPGNKLNDNVKSQRFMMCLKLFIIMSVFWLTEIISWAMNGPIVVWTIIYTWNALQGVLVFLICVYNRPVLVLLNKKLCPCFYSYNR